MKSFDEQQVGKFVKKNEVKDMKVEYNGSCSLTASGCECDYENYWAAKILVSVNYTGKMFPVFDGKNTKNNYISLKFFILDGNKQLI